MRVRSAAMSSEIEIAGEFRSTSQAGQDKFVRAVTLGEPGVFLDIGCSDPETWSNTRALERCWWTGLLIDKNPDWAAPNRARSATFICADAGEIDLSRCFDTHSMGTELDYLSFDVDEDSLRAFSNVPWGALRFRVLTIEHDAYRFGGAFRDVERMVLRAHGYDLVCPDVTEGGAEFEDWWVDLGSVDTLAVARLRTREPTEWREIVAWL